MLSLPDKFQVCLDYIAHQTATSFGQWVCYLEDNGICNPCWLEKKTSGSYRLGTAGLHPSERGIEIRTGLGFLLLKSLYPNCEQSILRSD